MLSAAARSYYHKINTNPKYEQFVRLLVLEAILELKDLFDGLQSMESPDSLGADLLSGLFEEDKKN